MTGPKPKGNKVIDIGDGSIYLVMSNGMKTRIDKRTLPSLMGRRICFNGRYAVFSHKGKNVLLHRHIRPAPKGYEVDHFNGDKLDNRESNLNCVTRAVNQHRKPSRANKKYRGVRREHGCNRWRAQISINGNIINLGTFVNDYEAALAYNEAAKKYHGELAVINIIPKEWY